MRLIASEALAYYFPSQGVTDVLMRVAVPTPIDPLVRPALVRFCDGVFLAENAAT